MQTHVQVICSKGKSVREAIVNDPKLPNFDLMVQKIQKQGRSPGWAKIKGTTQDHQGVLNIEWDKDTCILICRIVNRGTGKPSLILGDFVGYLMSRFRRRIKAITILPG